MVEVDEEVKTQNVWKNNMQRFNTSFQTLISYHANFNNKVHVNYEGIGGLVGRPWITRLRPMI